MAECFSEIEPLIAAFERGEIWVFNDPQARSLLTDRLHGKLPQGRKRSLKQVEFEFKCVQRAYFYSAYKKIPVYEKSGTKVTGCTIVAGEVHRSPSTINKYIQNHTAPDFPTYLGKWLRKLEANQIDCSFYLYMAQHTEKTVSQLQYEDRLRNAWKDGV